jgi:hypothetical protein
VHAVCRLEPAKWPAAQAWQVEAAELAWNSPAGQSSQPSASPASAANWPAGHASHSMAREPVTVRPGEQAVQAVALNWSLKWLR